MNFQIGDVVRLKSGGPLMTITQWSDSGWIICKWFADQKPETGSFPRESLEKE